MTALITSEKVTLKLDWAKLASAYRSHFAAKALDDWADLATAKLRRDTFPYVGKLEKIYAKRVAKQSDLYAYIGAQNGRHALQAENIPWLDISETQVAKGLTYFLKRDAPKGARALLKALDPDFNWPDYFDEATIEIEVPCKCDRSCPCGGQTGSATRIDILVCGSRDSQQWGAVIELKINNQKISNPLSDYIRFVSGRTCERVKYRLGPANAIFVVLAPHESAHTKRRLRHSVNKDWSYLEWLPFLRRLEHEIFADNISFQQFRRIVWEKLYI